MLSTKILLTLKSMGKFKCICKPQETHIFNDIQPVLQIMAACFWMRCLRPSPLPYISFFAAFSGWQVCKKCLCPMGQKRANSMTQQIILTLITWLMQCFPSLCVQLPVFCLCLYLCVGVHGCVLVLSHINLFPGQACSCSFCLSAIDNTEPSRDCSLPPSLTISLLCIHETIPRGKYYINKYLSSH